jgi:hypothetical protein
MEVRRPTSGSLRSSGVARADAMVETVHMLIDMIQNWIDPFASILSCIL